MTEGSNLSGTVAPAGVAEWQPNFRSSLGDIAQQSAIYFAGTTFALFVGYLFKIYVARQLGARLMGWNALGMGLYALCKLVGQMGLPPAALRYVAAYTGAGQRDRLHRFFWRALLGTLAGTSVLCFLVVLGRRWIAIRVFHAPEFAAYLPLFAALIPIGATSTFLDQTLCGFRRISRSTAITNFISFPCMMLFTVVGFALGLSLWGYVVAQVAGEVLTLLLVAWSVRRLLPSSTNLSELGREPLSPDVTGFALSMWGIGVLGFILGQADRLIVGFYLEAKELGIYAVASSAAIMIPLVLQSVNSIFGPTIANLHAQDDGLLLSRLFQTLTKWVSGLTLPLVLLFVLYARPLMGLFGADFQAGWLLLVVLSLGQAINCMTGSVGYLLQMSGHQKELVKAQALMGILLLVADFSLVPVWGTMAAALVAALGVAVTNLYYLWAVRRALGLFPYNRSYLRLIGPGLASALVIWVAGRVPALHSHSSLPGILVALVLGYTVFLVGAYAFGLDESDLMLVQVARERIASLLARYHAGKPGGGVDGGTSEERASVP